MSIDSSNPILRRLGVAGVGDERHFTCAMPTATAFIIITNTFSAVAIISITNDTITTTNINHQNLFHLPPT